MAGHQRNGGKGLEVVTGMRVLDKSKEWRQKLAEGEGHLAVQRARGRQRRAPGGRRTHPIPATVWPESHSFESSRACAPRSREGVWATCRLGQRRPPGGTTSEWELREGALGDQKFQGNGGEQGPTTQVRECAAARFSPRAQTQCRLCPPHPVDACTRGVRWGDSHRGLGARGA